MNQYWSLKRAVLVGVLTSTHYIMRPVLVDLRCRYKSQLSSMVTILCVVR